MRQDENGYTIIEMIIVMALVGILAFTAMVNLPEVGNPLANAAFSSENYFRLARTTAIAHTQAMVIAPISSTQLGASSSDSCDGTLTPIPSMTVSLPRRITFSNTSWSVCLNQRGLAKEAASFDLIDSAGGSKTVRVALGGGTMVE